MSKAQKFAQVLALIMLLISLAYVCFNMYDQAIYFMGLAVFNHITAKSNVP